MDIHLATARHKNVIAHVDAHTRATIDETVPVAFDMPRAHFFRPGETGATIV
jgi:hypothetical protein